MYATHTVTGTLTDDHTVTLDEALPLTPMKVRLAVEPLDPPSRRPYQEVIAEIRQRQRDRGYQPPSREQVDSYLQDERNSWEQ